MSINKFRIGVIITYAEHFNLQRRDKDEYKKKNS